MRIEGKGLVAPSPVKVRVTASDIAVLMEESNRRNSHRQYANSFSTWKKGLTANPILVGMVGELAVQRQLAKSNISSSTLDFALNNGDGGKDGTIAGVNYQIKTSTKSYPTCLVRRVDDKGNLLRLVADRFIFCKWDVGDTVCEIRGWCFRKSLHQSKLGVAKRGHWFNLEVHEKDFLPFRDLVALIYKELHFNAK